MRHYRFQCPQNFCLQRLIMSDTFFITKEPDELAIDFVGLCLLCSLLSDEADFETTLASSLLVAGRGEETPKKSGTLADDLFWDVSV